MLLCTCPPLTCAKASSTQHKASVARCVKDWVGGAPSRKCGSDSSGEATRHLRFPQDLANAPLRSQNRAPIGLACAKSDRKAVPKRAAQPSLFVMIKCGGHHNTSLIIGGDNIIKKGRKIWQKHIRHRCLFVQQTL